MNKRELFEKIYNNEIKENDVIVVHIKDFDEEYIHYILNNEFNYWYFEGDGYISLDFFRNKESQDYSETYLIISRDEFEHIIEERDKQHRIAELEKELKQLKGE